MKKRLLASFLSIMMILGMLPTVAMADEITWTEVATAEALESALEAGGYIKLTADLDLSDWTAANMDVKSFVLDGNNTTITGLTQPLIMSATTGSVTVAIQNLTITNSNIKGQYTSHSGQTTAAAFLAVSGYHDVTLTNCHLTNSTISDAYYAGGLIGYWAGQGDLIVDGCSVTNTNITAESSVGGFVGHENGGLTIKNSTVGNNTITCTDSEIRADKAGAVIGRNNGGSSSVAVTVTATSTLNPVGTNPGRIIGSIVGGSIKITGGAYLSNPTLVEKDTKPDFSDGFALTGNDEDGWVVAEIPKVAAVSVNSADAVEMTWNDAMDVITASENASATVQITLVSDSDTIDAAGWTSLAKGYNKTCENIVIDGNGKTLTGLTKPLITQIDSGTSLTVENLTIDASTIISDDTYSVGTTTAAIVGNLQNFNSATISNCHVKNSVISHTTGAGFAGAIIGYNAGVAVVIKDCSVTNTTVNGSGSTGAIIGHTYGATIENCMVSANTLTTNRDDENNAIGTVIGLVNAGNNYVDVDEEKQSTVRMNGNTITKPYAVGTNLAQVTITGGEYYTDPTETELTWDGTTHGSAITITDDYTIVQNYAGMYVLGKEYNIDPETKRVTLNVDKETVTGRGTVTLTVGGVDENLGMVICDVNTITLTYRGDGKWTATLPNETKTYTFSVTGLGENTASATVSVTKYTKPSSSGSSTPTRYAITVEDADNGDVTASHKSASKGSTVTITVIPDEGYELGSLVVLDKNGNELKLTQKGNNKFTFKMPAGKVTVEAEFALAEVEPTWDNPFIDVDEDDWFYTAVAYVEENGLMSGMTTDSFGPNAYLTRAMLAQVLYNLDEDAKPGSPAFTDVKGEWFADAVNWAYEMKVVSGLGNGQFGPNNNITREQLATILYNYANQKGYIVTGGKDIDSFPDAGETSAWAVGTMEWAVGNGLISGRTNGDLDPQGFAKRAEIASVLMNFCEKIIK